MAPTRTLRVAVAYHNRDLKPGMVAHPPSHPQAAQATENRTALIDSIANANSPLVWPSEFSTTACTSTDFRRFVSVNRLPPCYERSDYSIDNMGVVFFLQI